MSYTIQQLATHAGVSVRTVEHYIAQGAIPPKLGTRRHPIYLDKHLRALMRVRHGLEQNVTIEDFATPATAAHCPRLP